MKDSQQPTEYQEDEELMGFLSENSRSAPELSPMFSKNVMREIRLMESAENEKSAGFVASCMAWFQGHQAAVLSTASAFALVTVITLNLVNPVSDDQPPVLADHANFEALEAEEVSDFSESLLEMAAEDETFLTDGEVFALLY